MVSKGLSDLFSEVVFMNTKTVRASRMLGK
jgi:hypothetical protein